MVGKLSLFSPPSCEGREKREEGVAVVAAMTRRVDTYMGIT
jgi:hypothetical protein